MHTNMTKKLYTTPFHGWSVKT